MGRLHKVSLLAALVSLMVLVFALPAGAAGWLTPEWYSDYYNSGPTQPQPQQPPGNSDGVEQPSTLPDRDDDSGSRTTSGGWLSPDWYRNYNNANSDSGSTTQPPDPGSGTIQGMTSEERLLLEKINYERTTRGKDALTPDNSLTQVARQKSQDMVTNNYFSHTSPTYGKVNDMLNSRNISYRMAGENIAKARSTTSAHNLFMNSSIHRANILLDRYTHVGIGIVPNGSGVSVTEIFVQK